MKQFHTIIAVLVLFMFYGVINGKLSKKRDTSENCTEPVRKFRYDDGNIMEEIDPSEEQPKIQQNEKGTHHFGRQIIKPFIDVGAGAVSRIGKAFQFVTQSTGLDTNSSFIGNATSGTIDKFKQHVKMIYPGTRWCGGGDKAKSEDDLGTFKSTDMCCRSHDKCFDSIMAGEKKYGLDNTGLFTRSHCDCDHDFYYCLKNSTELVSKKIGFTYFSVLGPQCFKEENYVTGCMRYSRGKCIEYRTDPTKGKFYQWFDSPIFIGL